MSEAIQSNATHGRSLLASRGLWLALLLVTIVSVPALRVGFVNDDVMHRAMLSRSLPGVEREADGAYCFRGGPHAYAEAPWENWWAGEDLEVCFFRPLASFTLLADQRLFGENALGAHLHGYLWFLAACIAVFATARKLFGPRVATLAVCIYGLSNFSGTTVAWIAARHAVVSAAIAAIGLAIYVAGREDTRASRAWLGLAIVACALLGGEGALGGFGFIAAYELFRAKDAPKSRGLHVVVATAVALAFVLWYARAGFGAAGAGGYLDPMHHPLEFLVAAPGRLFALIGDAVLGIPSEAWMMVVARPVLVGLGVLSLFLVVLTWRLGADVRDLESTRALRFLFAGALLSALPSTAAVIGGRVLMLPGFGLSIGFAALLLPFWGRIRTFAGAKRVLVGAVVGLFALGLLVTNPLMRLAKAAQLRTVEAAEATLASSALEGCERAEHFLVLGTNELTVALYAPYLLAERIAARPWHQVTLANAPLELTRIDARTLRVVAREGDALGGMLFELLRPGRAPFAPGTTIPLGGPTIHVESATASGVQAFRIALEDGADDDVCWLRYDGERLVRTMVPAVGESMSLAYVPGPMSF